MLFGTWTRFYGQTDLRKAALNELEEDISYLFMWKIYMGCAILKMNEDLGTMQMSTPRQKKEQLVDAFPKDFHLVNDLCFLEHLVFLFCAFCISSSSSSFPLLEMLLMPKELLLDSLLSGNSLLLKLELASCSQSK